MSEISEENPNSENHSTSVEDVKSQLHNIFSKMFLRDSPENDQYFKDLLNNSTDLRVEDILKAPTIQAVVTDEVVIKDVLATSKFVIFLNNDTVRSVNAKTEQNTLILRDIPRTTPSNDILRIFNEAVLPNGQPCPGAQSVRADMNDTWFVTFSSEENAKLALQAIKDVRYNNVPVKARLKTESTVKSFFNDSRGKTPMNTSTNSLASASGSPHSTPMVATSMEMHSNPPHAANPPPPYGNMLPPAPFSAAPGNIGPGVYFGGFPIPPPNFMMHNGMPLPNMQVMGYPMMAPPGSMPPPGSAQQQQQQIPGPPAAPPAVFDENQSGGVPPAPQMPLPTQPMALPAGQPLQGLPGQAVPGPFQQMVGAPPFLYPMYPVEMMMHYPQQLYPMMSPAAAPPMISPNQFANFNQPMGSNFGNHGMNQRNSNRQNYGSYNNQQGRRNNRDNNNRSFRSADGYSPKFYGSGSNSSTPMHAPHNTPMTAGALQSFSQDSMLMASADHNNLKEPQIVLELDGCVTNEESHESNDGAAPAAADAAQAAHSDAAAAAGRIDSRKKDSSNSQAATAAGGQKKAASGTPTNRPAGDVSKGVAADKKPRDGVAATRKPAAGADKTSGNRTPTSSSAGGRRTQGNKERRKDEVEKKETRPAPEFNFEADFPNLKGDNEHTVLPVSKPVLAYANAVKKISNPSALPVEKTAAAPVVAVKMEEPHPARESQEVVPSQSQEVTYGDVAASAVASINNDHIVPIPPAPLLTIPLEHQKIDQPTAGSNGTVAATTDPKPADGHVIAPAPSVPTVNDAKTEPAAIESAPAMAAAAVPEATGKKSFIDAVRKAPAKA